MKDNVATDYLLDKESFFLTPQYLDASAWMEHIAFAFWIVEVCKPKIIVELGVHNAVSYFSFCQAVKRFNLTTACYGVDTWKGDEHAGFYEEEIFSKVMDYNNREYARFSTLIRSTFDDANNYFVDGSIDLMHIDGLHTYEAVKHDFENWLPKLTPGAIVIFHDINVRERNFGVFKLWEELKSQYKNFQFDFGHGLGIIVIGEVISDEISLLLNTNKERKYYIFLRNFFSDRGSFFKYKFDTNKLIIQQADALEIQKNTLSQLKESKQIVELNNSELQYENKDLQITLAQLDDNFEQVKLDNELLEEGYQKLLSEIKRLKESISIIHVANKGNLKEKDQIVKSELFEKLDISNFSFVEVINELADIKKGINELNTTVQNKNKIIYWYQKTYEDRSILGVLKEKFISKVKKKRSHNKEQDLNSVQIDIGNKDTRTITSLKSNTANNKYNLKPANDLIVTQNINEYTTIGADPNFIVELKSNYFSAGWYWLSIDVAEINGILLEPKLYYDHGRGFNEEDIWNLPLSDNGKIACLVHFPFDIVALRFDPTISKSTFVLTDIHLKSITKIKVLQIGILKYKSIYFPEENNLSFYKNLVIAFFKTGRADLKVKIKGAIYYNEKYNLDQYKQWCKAYDTISVNQFEKIKSLSENLFYKPLFSIIMPVYNAPVSFLIKAIESVKKQAYQNWELCIADDKSTNKKIKKILKKYQKNDERIRVIFRDTNGHISNASNSALELATGEFVVLLDQDDEIPVHSLYMVAEAINRNSNLNIIYSDEDKIDENGNRFDPYFKTDWNQELFYGQNMISHLGVYKHSLIKKIGGFREGYEGSQDYDLALRCIENLQPNQIYHVPHILYHWRAIEGSTSIKISNKNYSVNAGLRALQDHFKRMKQHATPVENIHNSFRIKWDLPAKEPLVSIIIPTKDKVDILSSCVTSILQKTTYPNFEILIIDNNSKEMVTHIYFEQIQNEYKQVKVFSYDGEFNFSAMNNFGVQQSKGDIIVLLNNDTSVINNDWLSEMVSQCLREEVGAVGAKLFYPNGQIQHAGVFLHEGHPGNHIYLNRDKNDPGYFNKLNLVQNYIAVTAACLAVRKEVYIKAGGLDEQNLKVAYNDVDFCLKLVALGYRNVWTPFAQLVHYESLTRGNDLDEINFTRFKKEHSYVLNKWKALVFKDPFFNSNLAIDTEKTQFAFPPRICYAWQDEIDLN